MFLHVPGFASCLFNIQEHVWEKHLKQRGNQTAKTVFFLPRTIGSNLNNPHGKKMVSLAIVVLGPCASSSARVSEGWCSTRFGASGWRPSSYLVDLTGPVPICPVAAVGMQQLQLTLLSVGYYFVSGREASNLHPWKFSGPVCRKTWAARTDRTDGPDLGTMLNWRASEVLSSLNYPSGLWTAGLLFWDRILPAQFGKVDFSWNNADDVPFQCIA